MKSETTDAVLASIDRCLATLNVPTRSTWTTREIENLLLDLRLEAGALMELDVDMAEFHDKVEGLLRADVGD